MVASTGVLDYQSIYVSERVPTFKLKRRYVVFKYCPLLLVVTTTTPTTKQQQEKQSTYLCTSKFSPHS